MALEERIIDWSQARPAWQREVMIRTATGDLLSASDYDRLIDNILAPDPRREVTFSLEHLPKPAADDPSVRLTSIVKTEHVNAIASDVALTFKPDGLTIVYGDNASGKSGYARLLKRITRARHQEDVLSDVFRDTAVEKPSANLTVHIGEQNKEITWPEPIRPELQRMLFYDRACGDAYITTESDFPYRPSALVVMDGLIDACVEVRKRIDAMLHRSTRPVAGLPFVGDEVKNTEAGRFLKHLSASTAVDSIDELIARFDAVPETIEGLMVEEAHLRSADTSDERQILERQAEKFDALYRHIENLDAVLADSSLKALQESRDQFMELHEAANLVSQLSKSEPLPGVGSPTWKGLWQSARSFSEHEAYPSYSYPVLTAGSRCVLCQQTLDDEGHNRLSRFEKFVKDDTQTRLGEARRFLKTQVNRLTSLVILPELVASNQEDLLPNYMNCIEDFRVLLHRYGEARAQINEALNSTTRIELPGIDSTAILTQLSKEARRSRQLAVSISDPEVAQQRLVSTTAKRQELELLRKIKNSRDAIVKEISRLKKLRVLEDAKSSAATGPITRKILEFSEESITEVVRDTFTRETERLRLERVTVTRTRAERGLAPPISLDSRLAKTAGPERKGRDGPEAEGEQGDRRS